MKKIIIKFKAFLAKEAVFSIGVFSFTIIASCFLSYLIYSSHITDNQRQLKIEAERIDNVLTDIFEEIYHHMVYLGKEITNHVDEGLPSILKIFIKKTEIINKNRTCISWPMFDWVNKDDFQVINQLGVVQKPVDFSQHAEFIKAHQNPWAFYVSAPTIGNPSGLWIIPAMLGITNSKGEFLGTITSGVEVSKISLKIQHVINSDRISFIILDQDLRIIVQSHDNAIDPKSSYYKDLFQSYRYFHLRQSILKNPIIYKNIEYSYYKKMYKHPYIILTGFDKQVSSKELFFLVGPRLLEIWVMGILCIILLYFFRKKILKIASRATFAREDFIRQLTDQTQIPFEYINKFSKIVFNYINRLIDEDKNNSPINEKFEKILFFLSDVNNFDEKSLTLKNFNINLAIQECLIIMEKITLSHNVIIKIVMEGNLPSFYGDEFRFKQIIIGWLGLCLKFFFLKGSIKISTSLSSKGNKEFFIIIIEDNGIEVNLEQIDFIMQKFIYQQFNDQSMLYLTFSTIEQLIELHQGTHRFENLPAGGKKFTIILPRLSKKSFPIFNKNKLSPFSLLSDKIH